MKLHTLLDDQFGPDGETVLRQLIEQGADLNHTEGPLAETPLHVATRRRRADAIAILLDHGAQIDAQTAAGKTCYAHAARRGFTEVVTLLKNRAANQDINKADQLAIALSKGNLKVAEELLANNPEIAKTGNPEEDRLLADMAGRNDTKPVKLLISAGAPLDTPGMDDGRPLHQAAWFGQPDNARLLIKAGASLDIFDQIHASSPIGWAVHGSRYSGGAQEVQEKYIELTQMLLEAGSSLKYPNDPSDAYLQRLLKDATPEVAKVLNDRTG